MWPWIKHWRDWAMHDLWPLPRIGPQPQALHYSFEKAGLTLHDQPIPWNAEVVLVEASLRLPPSARHKADFTLRLPNRDPILAERMRTPTGEERTRLFFRFRPPTQTCQAEVLWRDRPLGRLTLPILTREEFLQGLQLQLPTLFVRLGDQNVACQTFVSTQSRGLLASAVLASPTSLVPLLDLGFTVEFRSERGGPVHEVAASLCSSQLPAPDRHLGCYLEGGRSPPGQPAHPGHLATAFSTLPPGLRYPICRSIEDRQRGAADSATPSPGGTGPGRSLFPGQ
jgi:hypothetical protein